MENKYVLDTSFISALLNNKDSNHLKATKIYSQILKSEFIINVMTLIELKRAARLKIDLGTEGVNNFIKSSIDSIDYIDEEFIQFFNTLPDNLVNQLKPVDLCIAASGLRHKAKLVTFDEKLAKEYLKIQ